MGNGRFKIFDSNGKTICLGGRKNANGTNVHIWDDHDGPWMEWYLISEQTGEAFIPQTKKALVPATVSRTPEFFLKNKFFNYSESSMGRESVKGKANVEKIQENKIFVRIEGVRHNSDVAPGQPTEKAFSNLLEIIFENGKYLFIPDVYDPGKISDDGQTLSFSGDAYLELKVSRAPSEFGTWIRNSNSHMLTSYLRTVSYADLVSDDDGIIVTEVSKLVANKQVTLVLEMLGKGNSKDSKVRKHLYTELMKVIYKKPSGAIRFTVGAGFNNLVETEPVQEFKGILQDIERKISIAK